MQQNLQKYPAVEYPNMERLPYESPQCWDVPLTLERSVLSNEPGGSTKDLGE